MSTETATTIITINLVINSFLLGMLCYLNGWLCNFHWRPKRKTRAHLTDTKAETLEHAIDTAYAHHLTEEQRDHLDTLNPHKEND